MHLLTPKEHQRRKVWPTCLVGLLATTQLVLTFIIVGLEVTSMVFDSYHSISYAGFYCSLFFMLTWISMFSVTCCNRHSLCCATHTLVENILSIIAASVLLYFDNLFLNNPYTCLFGSISDCNSLSYYSSTYSVFSSTGYTIKTACIKAQLACAALMVITNIIYIIIFIVVALKTRHTSNQVEMLQYNTIPPTVGAQPMVYQTQVSPPYASSVPQQFQQISSQHTVECHQCHTLIHIA